MSFRGVPLKKMGKRGASGVQAELNVYMWSAPRMLSEARPTYRGRNDGEPFAHRRHIQDQRTRAHRPGLRSPYAPRGLEREQDCRRLQALIYGPPGGVASQIPSVAWGPVLQVASRDGRDERLCFGEPSTT